MDSQHCSIYLASQCLIGIVANRQFLSSFAADNLLGYRPRFTLPIVVICPPSQLLSISLQNNLELPITQFRISKDLNLGKPKWQQEMPSDSVYRFPKPFSRWSTAILAKDFTQPFLTTPTMLPKAAGETRF